MLNWRQPPEELAIAVEHTAQAKLLVHSLAMASLARQMGCNVEHLELEHVPGRQRTFTNGFVVRETDVALIMFTSGSTGRPKGVPITHAGTLWACRAKRDTSGSLDNGTLGFLPNFHVMGVVNNFLFNALCQVPSFVHVEAATVVLTPLIIAHAASDLKPDAIDTVPAILEALARHKELHEPFRATKLITCGGAPLSRTAYDALTASGITVIPHYGQTELGGGYCLIGQPHAGRDLMRPVRSVRAFLLYDRDATDWRSSIDFDSNHAAICGAKRGELIVLGCGSATPGYCNQPQPALSFATAHATGDVFECVEFDGTLWLRHVCRRDDIVVHSNGELTNPLPIEAAIHSSLGGAVLHVAVVGQLRPAPVLFVEEAYKMARNDMDISQALAVANAAVPAYSRIMSSRVIIVESGVVPVSAKGNVIRANLERNFRRQIDALDAELADVEDALVAGSTNTHSEQPAPDLPPTKVRDIVLRTAQELVGSKKILTDEPLLSAGLSSSGMLQLVRSLSERLGINSLKPTFVFDHPTVDAIVGFLTRTLNANGNGALKPRTANESTGKVTQVAFASRVLRSPPHTRSLRDFAERTARLLDAVTEIPLRKWDIQAVEPLPSRAAACARYGAFLSAECEANFDADFFCAKRVEVNAMDPQQRLLLDVGYEALHESGYTRTSLAEADVGTFTGIMNMDARELAPAKGNLNAYAMMGSGYSALGARISYTFALRGPCLVFDTACSSSLIAAHVARGSLCSHECESALVAAPNLLLLAGFQHIGTSIMGMMSPSGRCHTFDSRADGFVRGEGAGAVILEPLPSTIVACTGSAAKHNGRSASFTALNGASQIRLIRAALAGTSGAQIDSLETHGTGTALGDPIELSAATAALCADRSLPIHISGVKANAGHAESAAGVTGLIGTTCAITSGCSPPCAQLLRLNPHVRDVIPIRHTNLTVEPSAFNNSKHAGASSFGWSGIIAHAITATFLPSSSRGRTDDCIAGGPLSASLYRSGYRVPRLHGFPPHPLLQNVLPPATDKRFTAETRVAGNILSLFRDHVIAGTILLPGVASVELALSAALRKLDPAVVSHSSFELALADIAFLRPGVLADNCTIGVSIDNDGAIEIVFNGKKIVSGRSIIASRNDSRGQAWNVPRQFFNYKSVQQPPVYSLPVYTKEAREKVFVPASISMVNFRFNSSGTHSASLSWARDHSVLSASTDEVTDSSLVSDDEVRLNFSALRTRAIHKLPGTDSPVPTSSRTRLKEQEPVFYSLTQERKKAHTKKRRVDVVLVTVLATTCKRNFNPMLHSGLSFDAWVHIVTQSYDERRVKTPWMNGPQPFRTFLFETARYPPGSVADHILECLEDNVEVRLARRLPPSISSPIDISRPRGTIIISGGGTLALTVAAAAAPIFRRVLVESPLITSSRHCLSPKHFQDNVYIFHRRGSVPAQLVCCDRVSLIDFNHTYFNVHLKGMVCDACVSVGKPWEPYLRYSMTRMRGLPYIKTHVPRPSTSNTNLVTGAWAMCPLDAIVGLLQGLWSRLSLESLIYALAQPDLYPETPMAARAVPITLSTAQTQKEPTPSTHYVEPNIDVLATVRDIASSLAGVNVDDDSPLMEKGIDSLAATELVRSISQRFDGLDLPATMLFDYPTPAEIARLVLAEVGAKSSRDEDDTSVHNVVYTAPSAIAKQLITHEACISAAGCRLPESRNLEDLERLVRYGLDAGAKVPLSRWDPSALKLGFETATRASYGVFLDSVFNFDPVFFRVAPVEANAMDPQQRMVLEVGYAMLHHIGLDRKKLAGSITGVFLGMMNSDAQEFLVGKARDIRPFDVTGTGYATAAARLPYTFALQGPCLTIDTACSSTLVAAQAARCALKSREAVDAVVIGPNLILHQSVAMIGGAVAAMFSPHGRCHTLDARADGYLRAEACAGFVLSLQSDSRGANFVIPAIGVRHNGRASSFTALNGRSQQQLLRSVIEGASREAREIAFLEMHGTGTALGDPVEVGAASQLYAEGRNGNVGLALAAIKANVGHTESSAGAAGMLKALILSIWEEIGHNAQLRIMNPNVEAVIAPSTCCPVESSPSRNHEKCGVSSFGFSGIISHALLEKQRIIWHPLDSPSHAPSLYRNQRLYRTGTSVIAVPLAHVQKRDHQTSVGRPIENNTIVYSLQGGDAYLSDHRVNGKIVFPAAGYLSCIWMVLSGTKRRLNLKNFKITRQIPLNDVDSVELTVAHVGDSVTVEHNRDVIASATVIADNVIEDPDLSINEPCIDNQAEKLHAQDLYAYLRMHGYEYGPAFRMIKSRSMPFRSGVRWAQIEPTNNLVAYVQALLQVALDFPTSLCLPTGIERLQLNPSIFSEMQQDQGLVVGSGARLATSSVSIHNVATTLLNRAATDELEHEIQFLHPLKQLTNIAPPDEHARDMARHYTANAIARHLERNPRILVEKPWFSQVAKAASVHRDETMPAVNRKLYESSLYYRLHVDLYEDIPSLIDKPFWVISNHPEHDDFYESNYDMYELGVFLSIVAKDHFGSRMRIRELGAGSCGLTRRILALIETSVEEYVATDVSAIRLGILEGHPKIRRRRYDVNDPVSKDEKGRYHLVVADNVIHVGADMLTCLRNVCDSLVDGGYVIFEECVSDAPLYLWGLDSFIWETATDERAYGIWLRRDEWTRLLDAMPELELVTSFEVKHSVRLLLRYNGAAKPQPRRVITARDDISADAVQVYRDDGAEGLIKTLVRDTGTRRLASLVVDDNDDIDIPSYVAPHRFTIIQGGLPHVLVSIPLKYAVSQFSAGEFRTSGTHIVAGSSSGIALELVDWLFTHNVSKVVLVIPATNMTKGQQLECDQQISKGRNLEIFAGADFGENLQVRALSRRHADTLRGVWHLPISREGPLFENSESDAWVASQEENITSLKNLDLCTRKLQLDAFVVFSSLDVYFGSPGQANSNLANSARETVVRRRRALNLPGLAVQLGPIYGVNEPRGAGGFVAVNAFTYLESLDYLLPVASVNSVDQNARLKTTNVVTSFARKAVNGEISKKEIEAKSSSWNATEVNTTVLSMIKELLGMDLSPDERLVGAGVDSLMATQLTQELSTKFEFELPATFLFDYPTPGEMSYYILSMVTVTESEEPDVATVSESPRSSPKTSEARRSSYAVAAHSFTVPGQASNPSQLSDQLASSTVTNGSFPTTRWRATLYDTKQAPPATTYGAFLLDGFTLADLALWRTTAAEATSLHSVQLGILEQCTVAMREVNTDSRKIGVFVGGVGALSSTFNRDENKRPDVFALASNALAIAAGRVSFVFGLTGPCMSIDTACSSSLVALHTALRYMDASECGLALATTANALEFEASYVLNSAGTLSPRGRCHTFDARADGYARGESALTLVLNTSDPQDDEELVVVGPSRVLQDGVSASLTAPNGSSQRRLLREVAAIAGKKIGALRLEAHGTGTALGDPIEIGAAVDTLTKSFSCKVKCTSFKANIGHAEAAAGGAGIVALVSSLSHSIVPPNAQLHRLNEHLHLLIRSTDERYFAAPVADVAETALDGRVSSFGFSGTIAHVRFVVPPLSRTSGVSHAISLLRNQSFLKRPTFRGLPSAQTLLAGAAVSSRRRGNQTKSSNERSVAKSMHMTSRELLERVRRAAAEAVGVEVNVNEPLLSAVGFDSMAVSIIAGSISDSIGVDLPSTAFFDYPTVTALTKYIFETENGNDDPVTYPTTRDDAPKSKDETLVLESMSLVLPGLASNIEALTSLSSNSIDVFSCVPFTRWDATKATTPAATYGSFFVEIPPTPDGTMWRMPPAEVRSADPKQLLALGESYAALKASRDSLGDTAVSGAERTAVLVGTVGVICPDDETSMVSKGKSKSRGAYASTGASLAVTAGRVSYALSLEGPCAALDTACSTALVCLHFAASTLRNGECQRAVSTAVAWLDESTHLVIANAGMLSPEGKCFTLDSRANGYSRGEGCVAFVVSQSKLPRGAKYTVGQTAVQQDGASASLTAPNGSSQRRLLTTVALKAFPEKKQRVALLEGHGTGTALGDPIEVGSAHSALQACNVHVVYESFKANIGHLEPTAGAAGIVNVLAALTASTAAPNAQLKTLNSHLSSYMQDGRAFGANVGDPAAAAPVLEDGRVSSFGFSGTIAHTLHTVEGDAPRMQASLLSLGLSLFRKSTPFSAHSHLRGIATWQRLWAGLLENEAQQKIAAKASSSQQASAIAKDIDVSAVISAVADESFGYAVPVDEPLMALGLDSLGLGEMGAEFCDRLGVLLPATLLFDYPTINDVVYFVENEYGFGGAEKLQPDVVNSTPLLSSGSAPPALASICFDLPGARTSTELGELISQGHSTPSTVPVARWDSSAFAQIAGKSSTYGSFTDYRVTLDNACFKMTPLEAAGNDPQQLRLLELSYASLYSGVPGVRENGRSALLRQDYGVFAGAMGVTGRDDDVSYVPEKSVEQISALGIALSVMSGRVSFALGLTGPCLALDTACSTTLVTLHLASSAVILRECSRAVSAGTILLREVANVVGAIAGMLSNHGRCFTFDSRADGYARGEGTIACVVANAAAEENSLAVLGGTAVRQDGPSANLSAPNGSSQRKLLRAVVESPTVAPEIIVEAHGTGTMLGDPIEIGGVLDVNTSARRVSQITSLKGVMGHLETSAGAAGISSLLVALTESRHGAKACSVAMNPQLRSLNSHVGTLFGAISNVAMPVDISAVAALGGRINSFGFSGTIAHGLILANDATTAEDDESLLVPLVGRAAPRAGKSLFRTATPHKPFLKPELVPIQTAVAHGDKALYDELLAGPSSESERKSASNSSKRAAILERRKDVRRALEKILLNELMLDMNTAGVTDVDSIAMTQLVSSINDAFAIESEIGAFVALENLADAVSLIERCIAATPFEDEDDSHKDAPSSANQRRMDRRVCSAASVCIDHWGSTEEVVVFFHDETGSCAYVSQGFNQLTFARAAVITIQAPELLDQPSRILDAKSRVDFYAHEYKSLRLRHARCKLTVVGCGATIAIARQFATKVAANRLIAVDPSPGVLWTRGSAAFAKRFYRDYCCNTFENLVHDEALAAIIRRIVDKAPPDLTKLRTMLRAHIERVTLDDLEKLHEFSFHLVAMGHTGGDMDVNPDDIVRTSRGGRLVDAGWRMPHALLQEEASLPDTALQSPIIRSILGLDHKETRTFAYVPFVNTVDVEECLKCWKAPLDGAPSVIFIHGGIGVVGIAANYVRKLSHGVGLYAIQAPEHHNGDYDWAPTPKQRAERYLRVLMKHVPNGGVLIGYSFAGNICFEMALLQQEQRRQQLTAGGPPAYPFEFILLEPVPPPVPTRAVGETLLQHHARFVDKIMAEELFPAVFGIEGPIRLDAMARVSPGGGIKTVSELLDFVIERIGLDTRFATDFERMMEFIYNLKLSRPTGTYVGDVDYLMILPDGWKHYSLYWGYNGSLEGPWRDYIEGNLCVHNTIKGNHFQAFDTDENMENVKAVVDPLLERVRNQLLARDSVGEEQNRLCCE